VRLALRFDDVHLLLLAFEKIAGRPGYLDKDAFCRVLVQTDDGKSTSEIVVFATKLFDFLDVEGCGKLGFRHMVSFVGLCTGKSAAANDSCALLFHLLCMAQAAAGGIPEANTLLLSRDAVAKALNHLLSTDLERPLDADSYESALFALLKLLPEEVSFGDFEQHLIPHSTTLVETLLLKLLCAGQQQIRKLTGDITIKIVPSCAAI
jgi:hypothetical protein